MSEPAFNYTGYHSANAARAAVLDQLSQARLDHLYWMTDTPVRVIVEQMGLSGRSVSSLVTPLPAGFRCYRCRTEFHHSSRAARSAGTERRWSRSVTCGTCGEQRMTPQAAPGGVDLPTQRVVIAVRSRHGFEIDSCVEALNRIGKGWDERSLIMLTDGAEAIALGAALAAYPPGVLAMPSLGDLGASQAERLQTLWAITRFGWRVVTAHDMQVSHSVTKWDLDRAGDDAWESSRWHRETELPIQAPFLDRLLAATVSQHNDASKMVLVDRWSPPA